ncbi:dihydrodipicolinate synthase family protein [Dactylosporangium cerinum]|uniref:4-hydroxy-tetrahydrodipicolinate synthase n=1 Tax=Dactylosporangium cerinum TaxID=1434730 RepID=A0ABV9W2K9_9ACTN
MKGIFVPLVTPFDADGSVALGALSALARDVLDEGAAGLVALGTTGEPATLSEAERAAVVDVCRDACARHGVPLLVGVGGSSTAGTVAAVREIRGDVAMVVVPPYTRPGAAGVLAHLRAVAAGSPVPVVVYHVPYRTGQPLDVTSLLEIAAIPGVVGMKLSDGAVSGDTVAFLGGLPAGFSVLGGDDAVIAPLLAIGAAGGILASAHVATGAFVALAEAWRDGDVGRGRRLGTALAAVSAALFAEPNPAVIKAVLHATGRIPTPDVRLPLLPASAAATSAALRALDRVTAAATTG